MKSSTAKSTAAAGLKIVKAVKAVKTIWTIPQYKMDYESQNLGRDMGELNVRQTISGLTTILNTQ
jgi:hypothetical protein